MELRGLAQLSTGIRAVARHIWIALGKVTDIAIHLAMKLRAMVSAVAFGARERRAVALPIRWLVRDKARALGTRIIRTVLILTGIKAVAKPRWANALGT